jgi:hypothetical protein
MIDTLESAIETLNELDHWRVRAAKLRDDGKKTFQKPRQWHEELAKKRQAGSSSTPPKRCGSQTLEEANQLRALLCHRRPDVGDANEVGKNLTTALEKLDIREIADPEDDSLPILRAARVLMALAAAPDSALTQTAIFCYYVILRELYSAGSPYWLLGGARAGVGEGLPSCAFATNECIHALLSFAKTLSHTADYVYGLSTMLHRRRRQDSLGVFADLEEWLRLDALRAKVGFQITTELRKENIALKLVEMGGDGIDEFLRKATADVQQQINDCVANLGAAIARIEDYYLQTQTDGSAAGMSAPERIRVDAAHKAAMLILNAAASRATIRQEYASVLHVNDDESSALDTADNFLRYAAHDVRRALEPSEEYVSRALDRELTAASTGTAIWDVGELLFAAISYGYISGRWEEERLKQAADHASRVISERGRFPLGQPIHLSQRGYNLHVLNVDIIRAYAELLQYTKAAPLEPQLIRRLMYFVEDTVSIGTTGSPGSWVPSQELKGGNPWRSATASTILAMDAVNRMLDVRINDEILKHFSVREPDELDDVPELEDLFYPDYGLASTFADEKIRRRESVAVVLERMRAHVRGVNLQPLFAERLFSLILHGPPGTGKSTFVESLAKTSRARLVEITPSDLIAGGVDSIERTARTVFQALTLLTRVVIVFDEFDPVLLQRQDDQKEATAFSFLTPGMLPKLKALHKAAKRRSVAYVLNTNLIGKLDDAAVRGGRFDAKVGIYPPDILSRAGRLASAISDYYSGPDRKDTADYKVPANLKERFEHAVLVTRLGPMNTLAGKGWFTAPKEGLRSREDVFNFIVTGCETRRLEPECGEPRFTSEKAVAIQELKEFACVDIWDWIGVRTGAQLGSTAEEEPERQYSGQTVHEALAAAQPAPGAAETSESQPVAIRTLRQVLELCPKHAELVTEIDRLRLKHQRAQSAVETIAVDEEADTAAVTDSDRE